MEVVKSYLEQNICHTYGDTAHDAIYKHITSINSLEQAAKHVPVIERPSVDFALLGDKLDKIAYWPTPYRKGKIEKKKKKGQYREIYSTDCTEDKVVQYAVKQFLDELYEPIFKSCSYAYRPGRSAITAIRDIKSAVDERYVWAVKLDIRDFFGSINRELLLSQLKNGIGNSVSLLLIRRLIEVGYYCKDKQAFVPQNGLLQGMIISPTLANIYLHNTLDIALGVRYSHNSRMFRYCDDILILSSGRKRAQMVSKAVKRILLSIGLSYESVGPVDLRKKPIDFLGFENKIINGELLQSPTEGALQYIKAELANASSASEINDKVTGWRNYYSINPHAKQKIEEAISTCHYKG